MLILSIDCAVTNMAFCVIEYDPSWKDEPTLGGKLRCSAQAIRPLLIGHCNLTPGKKVKDTSVLDKIKALKVMCNNIRLWIMHEQAIIDYVLIEYQMGPNVKTTALANCLAYEWLARTSSESNFDCEITCTTWPKVDFAQLASMKLGDTYQFSIYPQVYYVGPSLKNRLTFAKYQHFIEKKSNYVANKQHSVANLKKIIAMFEWPEDILPTFKHLKLDDVADAVCMCLAWLRFGAPRLR